MRSIGHIFTYKIVSLLDVGNVIDLLLVHFDGSCLTFQIVSLLHVGVSSAWEPWIRHRALEPKNQPHRQDMLHLLARHDGAN